MDVDCDVGGIVDSLCKYVARKPIRMHMPGHKGKPARQALDGCRLFDVTECPGLDNLHYPSGCILRSEEKAQRVFGSLRSYFLVNGASCGVQASFLAARMVLGPGKVIVPRSTHKSAISAMVMSGFEPVWVWPQYYEDFGGYLPITKDDISEALRLSHCSVDRGEVKAVFDINPTYCGFARDLSEVAEFTHSLGAMLIVDEAHGTHFGFDSRLPQSALKCGADIVIHGSHKTTTAFTQTGLLHISSGAQDRFPEIVSSVEEALRSMQSTSPSYLLLSSLEQAIDLLERDESVWVKRGIDLALGLTERLASLSHIKVPGHIGSAMPQGVFHDPSRVLVDLRELSVTGPEAARYLAHERSIVCEMAGPSYLVMIVTGADERGEMELVADGFEDLSLLYAKRGDLLQRSVMTTLGVPPRPVKAQSLRESFLSESEPVEIESSRGRVAADTIVIYPPGSPLIVPGEVIDSEIIDYILKTKEIGLNLVGRAMQRGCIYCIK